MKKAWILGVLLLLSMSTHAQLLWKISGHGLTKPSYVIGTYHLAPVTFVDSIPGLHDALAASEQVYGELDMNVLKDMSAMMKMQQAMMLPSGQTLDKLLTAEQLTRFNAFVKQTVGVDPSTNSMVAAQLYGLTPAALETQFTMLLCLKQESGFDPQNLFDGYFQKTAAEQGKTIGGLETLDFQVKTLYQGKSIERQITSLMCLIDHSDYAINLLERTRKAFFAQDIDLINALSEEKMGNDCDATPEELDQLLYNRNADWVKQLPSIMQAKSTLVAVGAAHLAGDRGLLALLRKAGYEVSAVK